MGHGKSSLRNSLVDAKVDLDLSKHPRPGQGFHILLQMFWNDLILYDQTNENLDQIVQTEFSLFADLAQYKRPIFLFPVNLNKDIFRKNYNNAWNDKSMLPIIILFIRVS